jgi:glutathione peroxidase
MKFKLLLFTLFASLFTFQSFTTIPDAKLEKKSIYDFKVKDINGNDFDFADLKGKKIMIVNTASQCLLADNQFAELEKLYQRYKNDNFVIVAFPSSDFMDCETASNVDINATYKEKYKVSFPVMEKVSVKGSEVHELYKFLTNNRQNKVHGCGVLWNFQKYLIGEDGALEKIVNPKISPSDSEIISWITKDKSPIAAD